MNQIFPILNWLPNYHREYLKNDLFAGFTVAVMLIPQAMAYALLAGLPPVHGLYAAFVPLIVYPVFGTCRQLAVGPVALDSMLVAAGIGLLANPGTDDYLVLAALLAVMVGTIQLLVGVARLGFVVDFLSNPVISGFTSAAAVIIIFGQLRHMSGIGIPNSQEIDTLVTYLIFHLDEFHLPTFLTGILCLVLLIGLKKWRSRVPGALVAVVLSTLAVWAFGLEKYGISIVGDVPEGLPIPRIPEITLAKIESLMPIALTLSFVSFMEAFAVAKRISAKRSYEVEADRELLGLGAANISSGLFGGFSIAGSFSRTAVNAESGAQTGVSSMVSAGIVGITTLFLTPLFYYMPKAVFAAVIIVAVYGLIDVREARRLFEIKKSDFLVMVFAFVITLLLGIQRGVLLSVVASVVMILRRITRPKIVFMGEVPGTEVYRNVHRVANAGEIPGLIIIRMDASFYFANISYFKDQLYKAIQHREEPVKMVIIDGSSINEVDSSAESVLRDMVDELKAEGISLNFTNLKGYITDMMKKSGFYEKLGNEHFFFSKKDAVRHFFGNDPETPMGSK